ncbi:Fanconi anemia group J [Glycine max]|nr:Fanconi anemia group J [Glycine max]
MISASNPNPKNVYHIGGLQVEFPYQPYGSQFAFMGRVISTLNRAQKEGHCHALLESPTGTGKSLSLLCSSLAWQHHYKSQHHHLKSAHEATADPLAYGGESLDRTQSEGNNKKQKKKEAPTIYYASRTHSQISQVVRELRKTAYRVPMAVLASRKHYCTNKNIMGKENINDECKLLLKDQATGCPEFKNAHKVKGHPSLHKGGCNEVHDIEDLVKVGQLVKGCSYYAARSMSDDAQLVFCPYNYIINPVIRAAMDVDIKGAIVILDEAHNIEDIARDAGSVDIEEDVVDKLQMELQQLCSIKAEIYQPLYEMTQGLTSWMEQKKNKLEKRDFQHYVSCWTGDKALRELEEANISKQCFPILLECATKAIKVATDLETDAPHISAMSVITLEGLFSSLTYFFSRNGSHMLDYQLALQRCIREDTDERFRDERNRAFISKWLRRPLRVYDSFDLSLEGLKSFFEDAKKHYGINTVHATQSLGLNGDVVQIKDQNAWFKRKKNQKLNKSGNGDGRETSVIENNMSFPTLTPQDLVESQPSAQKSSNTYNCKYLPQCCNQTEPRFTGESSVAIIHEETSIVMETPCIDVENDPTSPDYSKDDNSGSIIIEASAQFADHLSSLSIMSLTKGSKNSSRAQSSITITPKKNVITSDIPEMESVNSHNQKRRNPMVTPFINLVEEDNFVAPCASPLTWYTKSSVDVREITHGSEYGFKRILKSNSPPLLTSTIPGSCSPTAPPLDKRLQIFCSLCKSPLGRPENHLYLTCSLISSSKNHLRSLLKQRLKTYNTDTLKSVPVIITDSLFVDQRICNGIPKSAMEQGIWCPEDGCVFSTIFCPFCSNINNLLGVQIMATDSSNVQLLDKILFYFDSLEVKSSEESGNVASGKVDLSPVKDSREDEIAVLNSIEKYSYFPRPGNSEV